MVAQPPSSRRQPVSRRLLRERASAAPGPAASVPVASADEQDTDDPAGADLLGLQRRAAAPRRTEPFYPTGTAGDSGRRVARAGDAYRSFSPSTVIPSDMGFIAVPRSQPVPEPAVSAAPLRAGRGVAQPQPVIPDAAAEEPFVGLTPRSAPPIRLAPPDVDEDRPVRRPVALPSPSTLPAPLPETAPLVADPVDYSVPAIDSDDEAPASGLAGGIPDKDSQPAWNPSPDPSLALPSDWDAALTGGPDGDTEAIPVTAGATGRVAPSPAVVFRTVAETAPATAIGAGAGGGPGQGVATQSHNGQGDTAADSHGHGEAEVQEREGRAPSLLREVAVVLVITVVLSFLLKTFLVQSFSIPSESMENTLYKGDRILVSKLAPGLLDVHRGDVVVFEDDYGWLTDQGVQEKNPNAVVRTLIFIGLLPDTQTGHLVKRIIGMGGDTVECGGTGEPVKVNGVALDETYLKPGSIPSEKQFSVTVPPGMVFVMGDNRQNSSDSRYHTDDGNQGFVPLDNIVGVADARTWPVDRWAILRNPGSVFAGVPDPK